MTLLITLFCYLSQSSNVSQCIAIFSVIAVYFEALLSFLICFILQITRYRRDVSNKEQLFALMGNLFTTIAIVFGANSFLRATIIYLNN